MKPKRSRSRLSQRKTEPSRARARKGASKSAPSSSPSSMLDSAKSKMGGFSDKVSEEKLHQLAQGVRPEDMSDEQKMRELIHQVSKAFNVPVDEQTIRELTKTLKGSDFNQIGAMLGNMLKK